MDVGSIRERWKDLFSKELVDDKARGEIYELIDAIKKKDREEIKDELSDIAWGIGRMLGNMLGKPYVRIPGDSAHYHKCVGRMQEYNCMRSKRFLIDGQCPNK
jgi:hypothetical protein